MQFDRGVVFFRIDCRWLQEVGRFEFEFDAPPPPPPPGTGGGYSNPGPGSVDGVPRGVESANATAKIKIPFSEFLVRESEETCAFGAVAHPSMEEECQVEFWLGANFLRGAYGMSRIPF